MSNQKELSFSYDYHKIRAVVDSNNELLFCLVDILKVLNWYCTASGIVADKIKAHFKLSEIPVYKFNHAGGAECFIITKSWLYFIIASVRGKKAHKANHFIKWVETEILSSVKQIEPYELEKDSRLQVLPQETQVPKTYAEALLEAGQLALENEKLLTQIKENHQNVEVLREFLIAYRNFISEVDKILDKLDESL